MSVADAPRGAGPSLPLIIRRLCHKGRGGQPNGQAARRSPGMPVRSRPDLIFRLLGGTFRSAARRSVPGCGIETQCRSWTAEVAMVARQRRHGCAALLVQGEPQRVITRPTDRRPAPVAYFAAINLQAAAGPLRRARKRPSPTRCSGPQSRLLPVACVAALYSSGPDASRGNSAAGPEERRFLVPTGVGAFGTRPANCGPVCGVAASRKQPRVGPARRGISASEQAAEQTRRSDPGRRVPAPCG